MDTIGMMITHIRNGYKANQKVVYSIYSRMLENILKILTEKDIIAGYKVTEVRTNVKRLEIELKDNMKSTLKISRVSKPGRRVYVKAKDISTIANGYGFSILSTPKGVLDNITARKENVGGEVVCEVV